MTSAKCVFFEEGMFTWAQQNSIESPLTGSVATPKKEWPGGDAGPLPTQFQKGGRCQFDYQHRPTQEDVGKEPTNPRSRKDRAKQF